MPSYYDSIKKKPGKAKRIYRKGGKVKKMAHGGIVEPKTVSVGVENGHDVTLARGSGAARSQKFRKNG
tara:strand:- start:4100 stop:4303 length:204 start_codon:yes stop_codon:yes gene_type:complete